MSTKFTLPNGKITVKFLFKEKPGIDKDHVLYGGKLDGTVDRLCAKMSMSNSKSVVSPFSSKEEQEFLEKELNLNPGGLSEHDNPFWDKCFVILKKADTVLNISYPTDYIKYKILLQYDSLVAKSYKDRNNVDSIKYYMVREDEINIEKAKDSDIKAEAYYEYHKIAQEKSDLLNFVLAQNKKVTIKSVTTEWLKTEISNLVEKDPSYFLSVIKDRDYKEKALLGNFVNNGLVTVNHGIYSTIDGVQLAAENESATYENAINFLRNKKNQPVIIPLKERLGSINS